MTKRRTVLLEVTGPVVVLAAWWLATHSSELFFFPALGDIGSAFVEKWLSSGAFEDALPSIARFAVGYGLACLLGIAIGVLIGLNRWLADAADPVVQFLRALPPPVLIPFGILVLGVGDGMKITIIAFGALWPVMLNAVDGIRSVEPTLLETARAYQIPPLARLHRVIVPSALPQVFAGMRTSLAVALALMIISEMIASTNGIGYFVLESQRTFAIPEMWAGIVLLGLLGYIVNLLFLRAERRALAWHAGFRGHVGD